MSVQHVLVKRVSSASASVDEKLLRMYLLLGARDADLSAMLGISISTLRRYFGETLRKVRAERRTNIRRMVWQKAKDGNVPLLIWLARQELERDEEPAAVVRRPNRKRFDYQRFVQEFQRVHDIDRNAGDRSAQADGSG